MLKSIRQAIRKTFKNNEPKYPLKFYENNSNRCNVNYRNTHICTCNETEKQEIQDYFDKNYKGNNIKEISDTLKEKYNHKIQRNKSYTKKRGKKPKPYTRSTLQFQEKKGGRVQVRVNDKGKVHTVCQCYPHQTKEVERKYNTLKKTHSLDKIKQMMKQEYNLRGMERGDESVEHKIVITNKGQIYKDGKYCKVNNKAYEMINKEIGDIE